MGTDEAAAFSRLLANGMRNLMQPRQVEVRGIHQGHWIVFDRQNKIRSVHSFPLTSREAQRFSGVTDGDFADPSQRFILPFWGHMAHHLTIKRRSRRIQRAMRSTAPIGLVRHEDSAAEAFALWEVIRDLRRGRPFMLIAAGPDPEFRHPSLYEGLRFLPMTEIDSNAGPDSWKGSRREWNRIRDIIRGA